MKTLDKDRITLQAFAWPGGYPILYLARDGWREEDGILDLNRHDRSENVCCAKCAADIKQWPDIIITAQEVHYEGSPYECEYCNSLTESAYGDPAEADGDDERDDYGMGPEFDYGRHNDI